jgi:hypothetical protein
VSFFETVAAAFGCYLLGVFVGIVISVLTVEGK